MRLHHTVPKRGAALCALLVTLLFDSAQGQELLRSYPSPATDGQQGRFTAVGDVNDDGVSDHVLGAPSADSNQGLAQLISGADGVVLATLSGEAPGTQFGWSAAAVHDVDGDGIPDFAVGAPATDLQNQDGSVFLFSGADAAQIRRLDGNKAGAGFGYSLAGLGDIDSDGYADVLIASPFGNGDRGQISAFSGDTGALLGSRSGNQSGDQYGISIAGTFSTGDGSPEPIIGKALFTGDGSPEPIIGAAFFNGDGSPEPIIGASQASNDGPGYIEVLSRTDLSLLGTSYGDSDGDRFGLSVSQAGDVNGDSVLDFIVGASPASTSSSTGAPGYVRVLSGWDGSVLMEFTDNIGGSGFGSTVAGIGDMDNDGYDDLAVGAPSADGVGGPGSASGAVRIYNGNDGTLAQLITGYSSGQLGSTVAFVGDMDGDGKADVALGAANDNGGAGTVSVFSLYRWIQIEGGVSGSEGTPTASGNGSTSASSDVTLSLRNALPDAATALIVGFSLAFDSTLGTLLPNADIVINGLSTDVTGSLDYMLTLPVGMSADDLIYYQFLVEDPTAQQGTARSNVVAARGEAD
ncbi:MAG: hypothetical protein ACI9EF_002800 [Pseudohongiellaceae bacterium]|jgi:hypothetical protein